MPASPPLSLSRSRLSCFQCRSNVSLYFSRVGELSCARVRVTDTSSVSCCQKQIELSLPLTLFGVRCSLCTSLFSRSLSLQYKRIFYLIHRLHYTRTYGSYYVTASSNKCLYALFSYYRPLFCVKSRIPIPISFQNHEFRIRESNIMQLFLFFNSDERSS